MKRKRKKGKVNRSGRQHKKQRASSPSKYPSPKERQRIIQERTDVYQEFTSVVVESMITNRDVSNQMRNLVQKYGLSQVKFAQRVFTEMSQSRGDYISDETQLYREYRRVFARYGEELPFFNREEYETLTFEFTKLMGKRLLKQMMPIPFIGNRPSARERELHDLLLKESYFWEDITPLAIPSRPDAFSAPQPAAYEPPVQRLLEWGWQLDDLALAKKAKTQKVWQPATSALLQIVYDEGLRNGCPGEKASWHALSCAAHVGLFGRT